MISRIVAKNLHLNAFTYILIVRAQSTMGEKKRSVGGKDDVSPNPVNVDGEISEAERLEKLFLALDGDRNGKIDIAELTKALKGSKYGQQYAEVSEHDLMTYIL